MSESFDVKVIPARENAYTHDQHDFIKYLENNSKLKVDYQKDAKGVEFFAYHCFLETVQVLEPVYDIFIGLLSAYLYDYFKSNPQAKARITIDKIKTETFESERTTLEIDKDTLQEILKTK